MNKNSIFVFAALSLVVIGTILYVNSSTSSNVVMWDEVMIKWIKGKCKNHCGKSHGLCFEQCRKKGMVQCQLRYRELEKFCNGFTCTDAKLRRQLEKHLAHFWI